MELSRPVVVQHQGHLTLTFEFQGQILKKVITQECEGPLTWNKRDVSW